MTISKDQVVSMNYVLKNDKGEIMDQSKENPLTYLHGHRNIVPGLEKELGGLKVGEKKSVKVSPAEGYGEHDPKLRFPLPLDRLGDDVPPIGALLELESNTGQSFVGRVVEAREKELILDANHPLAGETLHFEIEITSIRQAEANELEHGHVHGPGCSH